MAQHLAQLLVLLLTVCCSLVKAGLTVVDGQDQSILYYTDSNGSSNATWTKVDRSPDSCDTPQMLTSRIGDYMTFTFTGTGVQVVGTVGVKRGLIQFALDGQNTTLKDRTAKKLACDSVLYEVSGLPNQQHTVMGTLVGKDVNLSSGAPDGVFSVQRIRYTTPGGGSVPVGAIAGGVAAGVVALVAAVAGIWWYLRRKKRQSQDVRRASAGAFIDSDDLPSHVPEKGGFANVASPGIIATPFEWNGPGSQYGTTPGRHSQALPNGMTPTSETGRILPSPPTTSSNLGPHSSYFPPGSSSDSRTNTYSVSSTSDLKRDSNLAGTSGVGAALGYHVTHPDSPETVMASPRASVHPAGDQRSSTVIDDVNLVDRIANRLADIMTTRGGGVGVLDQIVPPPVYTGPGGPEASSQLQSHQSLPPTNAGSPQPTQSTLPYPPSRDNRDSAPSQLPYAQYPYQSSSPPPRNEPYPGSNRF